jgi:hypothetical protein
VFLRKATKFGQKIEVTPYVFILKDVQNILLSKNKAKSINKTQNAPCYIV